MDMGLTGKVVLITGAGRNIGRATAEAFAAEGARLVLTTHRSSALLEQSADVCRSAGAEVVTALCDVSDEDQVKAMVQTAERAFGGVDVLVNNAANRVHGPFPRTVQRGLACDLRRQSGRPPSSPAARCCQAWSSAAGGASSTIPASPPIVEAALSRLRSSSASLASPAGLAREFGKHGVTVNAIAPSSIEGERDPGTERDVDVSGIDPKLPIPRFGQPEEVAALVVYLCSKHAGYVTGQTFHINGGDILQ